MAETEVASSLKAMVGLAGSGLLLGCSLLWAARARRRRPAHRIGLLIFATLLCCVPIRGLAVSGYIRGFTGDLSITTLVLLIAAVVSQTRGRRFHTTGSLQPLFLIALAGGLTLYPLACGLTVFDPYTWGYQDGAFLATTLGLCLAAACFEWYWVTACLTMAALAHRLGLLESGNLWDYVIDPLLVVYAAFWLLYRWRSVRGNRLESSAP